MKLLDQFDKVKLINSIRTHYYDTLNGDPIVLIHGGGSSTGAAVIWTYNVPHLAKNFRVIAPDELGFGLTEMPAEPDYSLAARAEHIVALLSELGVKSAFVVGQSQGSWISCYIAIKYPSMVKKLILTNSASISSPVPFRHGEPENTTEFTEKDVERWVQQMTNKQDLATEEMRSLRLEYGKRNFEISKRRDQATGTNNARLLSTSNEGQHMLQQARFRNSSIDGKHMSEVIARITAPTLIIWGMLDTTPLDRGIYILNHIKGAQLHVFSDAKHEVFIDQYEMFNELVTLFCKRA